MTIGPEQRKADALNADMRKGWATGDYEQTIEAHHRRLNAENIDLRGQLEMARKATSAAQELLEAERQKNAALTGSRQAVHNDAMRLLNEKQTLKSDLDTEKLLVGNLAALLDTEKLLRVNDAATIADLERRLREAEGKLKAQRLGAGEVAEIRAYVPYGDRVAKAENVELRRTISLMAKTAAEVQDNFRLIAELAADPADEARKIESDPF